MKRSWALVLLGPLALWLMAGASPWALTDRASVLCLLPGLALLALRFVASRDRRLLRLGAHLDQLRSATLTAFVAPAGAMLLGYSLSNQPLAAEIEGGSFTLYVVLCALQVIGVASDFRDGTSAQWLTQPRSLRWLLAERLLASTLASMAAVGTLAIAVPDLLGAHTFGLVLAAALGGAGLISALSTREPVAATVTSGVLLSAPALLWAWRSESTEVIDAALTVPLAAWSLALLVLGFWQARRFMLTPEPRLPSWRTRPVGRTTPLNALVRKELRLQVFTVLVGSFAAISLRVMLAGFGAFPGQLDPSLFFAVVIGLLSGLISISEEHHHGTIHADALALPTSIVWRTKVSVASAVNLLVAVVLPLALFEDQRAPALGAAFVLQATVAAVSMTVGLVAASAAKQLSRGVFIGLLLLLGLQLASGALMWLGDELVKPLEALIAHLGARPHGVTMSLAGVVALGGLTWASALGAACLAVARRTWLTSALPWPLVARLGGALGLLATLGSATLRMTWLLTSPTAG
jgi:hypothetical protein